MGRNFTILLLLVIISVEFVAAEGKSKSKWSNLYIIVIYVAFFALAILVSVLIRRYRNGRLGTAEGAGNDQPEHATRGGMEAEDIESLPSLRFSEIKMHKVTEQGQRECAVCLSEFKDQEILRILPDCITPWLKSHVTCPVCRTSLDHRQGSSVSTSSILERISGVFSERFEGISGNWSSELYRVEHPDDDDDQVGRVSTAEIEGSTSLQVDLDGTRGEMVIVRCYSTGDLGVRFEGENGTSAENWRSLGRVNSQKVDNNREIISEKSTNLSCVSSRSDSFVDYSSLLDVNGSTFV